MYVLISVSSCGNAAGVEVEAAVGRRPEAGPHMIPGTDPSPGTDPRKDFLPGSGPGRGPLKSRKKRRQSISGRIAASLRILSKRARRTPSGQSNTLDAFGSASGM